MGYSSVLRLPLLHKLSYPGSRVGLNPARNGSEQRESEVCFVTIDDHAIVTKQEARRRPRSFQAISQSEEWLFTTLESTGDAVIATDADGKVIFMNRVAVQLTGWNEEEAQGRDCRDVFHIVSASTRKETESPVTKVLRDGTQSGLANNTILISKHHIEYSIDDSGSPIRGKSGAVVGVILKF